MTTNNSEREEALRKIQEATEQLARTQDLANMAITAAGNNRARAIKNALHVLTPKELATELNVSVQRVYKLAREAD